MFKACVGAAINIGKEKISHNWSLLASGKSGDIELERKWLKLSQKSYELFCAKNHDYGTKNLSAAGMIGLLVRMGDKVSRLWTLLLKKHDNDVGESVYDTLIDLLNYTQIALLFVDGTLKKTGMDKNIGVDAKIELMAEFYHNMSDEERTKLFASFLATEIADDIGGTVVLK